MEDNPYGAFASMFRKMPELLLAEGTMVSVSPLRVEAFGLCFAGTDLQVNAQLLSGWPQQVRIDRAGTAIEGNLTAQNTALQPGDRVLLVTQDRQTLYILCKVVSG